MARPDQLSRRPAIVGLGCAFAVAALLGASATRAVADDVTPPAATTVATPADTVSSDPIPTPDRAPVPPKTTTTPKKAAASTPSSKPATPPMHATRTSLPQSTHGTQSTHATLTPQSVQTSPVQHVVQATPIVPAVTHHTVVTQHTGSPAKGPAVHRTVHKKKVQAVTTKETAKPIGPAVKHHAPAATNAPAPLPAVLPTLPTAPVKEVAHATSPAFGLMLLVLGLVAVGLLALAAAPVSIIRTPAVVRLAMHGRPALGALGFSLLGAVVILYVLTQTGA